MTAIPGSPSARQSEAIATLALLAALADHGKDEAEQARLAELFGSFGAAGTASVHQRVLLGNVSLEEEANALTTPELRQFAYEMAAGVCNADGAINEPERAFLDRLRAALGLPGEEAQRTEDGVAQVVAPPAAPAAGPAPGAGAAAGAGTSVEAELEPMILQGAILAGALELLPQGLATLGIVPLQMKLVYDIGAKYGYRLDQGHVKEFAATLGLGMTSQVVEGFARKFFGGLVRQVGGRGLGGVAGAATGAVLTFASTYALGHVAMSYYAGGRKLDSADLKRRFEEQLAQGQALFERYRGEVESKARSVNPADLRGFLRL